MSSYQQTNLRITTKARLTGNKTVDLSPVLGQGGCGLLLHTLDQLGTGGLPVGQSAGFQWKCVDRNTGHYSLAIGSELPAGVQALTVNLKLHGGLAEVSHEATYSVTQAQTTRAPAAIPVEIDETLRGTANRAVNRLLALTVASHVTQRMTEQVRQTAGVRVESAVAMRLRNTNSIQTVARLRARGM